MISLKVVQYNILFFEAKTKKKSMLPINNAFNIYPYHYQPPFHIYPSCFVYPTSLDIIHQSSNPYRPMQQSQQNKGKDLLFNATEVSADVSYECKKEETVQIKSIVRSIPLEGNQVQVDNPKLKKNKNQYQKQGRNANSNLLRMFFRFFHQRLEQDPEIITRCIKKNRLKIKMAKFMEWIQLNDVEHRNYVRLPDMKELFAGGRGSRDQAKIMRILLKDFIQHQALPCYLTSKKIKRDSMYHNLNSIRNILTEIVKTKK